MINFKEKLKIAKIHVDRIQYAQSNLKKDFPLSATTLINFPMEKILLAELLSSRFSKLQDFMGAQIFSSLLSKVGENIDQMTYIDKINKLEKLGLVESADEWKAMRQIRNHLAHEYPDHPELTADNLNHAYEMSFKLIETLNKMIEFEKKY